MNTSTLVQKLWNYCNVLRDDGMKLRRLRGAAHLEQFKLIAGDLGAELTEP